MAEKIPHRRRSAEDDLPKKTFPAKRKSKAEKAAERAAQRELGKARVIETLPTPEAVTTSTGIETNTEPKVEPVDKFNAFMSSEKQPKVPVELKEIFGDDEVPNEILHMDAKLKGKRRESYREKVRADRAEQKGKTSQRQVENANQVRSAPKDDAEIEKDAFAAWTRGLNRPPSNIPGASNGLEDLYPDQQPDPVAAELEAFLANRRRMRANLSELQNTQEAETMGRPSTRVNAAPDAQPLEEVETRFPSNDGAIPQEPLGRESIRQAVAIDTEPAIQVETRKHEAEEYQKIEDQVDARIEAEKPASQEPATTEEKSEDDNDEFMGKDSVEVRTLEELRKEVPGISAETEAFMDSGGFLSGKGAEVEPDVEATPDAKPETRREWTEKLREAVAAVVGSTKEKVESMGEQVERMKGYLKNRAAEIDAEAGKYGATEKAFRKIGEEYNKLSWKQKIALGVTLGVGAAGFATVSVPLALGFTGALAAQRALGMAGAFVKFEKLQKDEAESLLPKKERAMWKAIGYTLVMGAAIKEGVELASESAAGDWVHEWLRHHYPFKAGGLTQAHTTPHATETPQHTTAANSADGQAAARHFEPVEQGMPLVGASPHGYEGMLKDMIKQLSDQPPQGISSDSDLAQLYEAKANPESMGRIIHNIATNHHAFTDHGSVLVGADAHMTIDSHGNVMFNGEVQVPENAPVTLSEAQPDAAAPTAEAQSAGPEQTATDAAPPTDASPVESVPQSTSDAPLPPAIEHSVVTNQIGLEIPSDKPHIYEGVGTEHFVYGGTQAQKEDLMFAYLKGHPTAVILSGDESGTFRVPYYFVEGDCVPGDPLKTAGFLGILKKYVPSPGPDDFTKMIT